MRNRISYKPKHACMHMHYSSDIVIQQLFKTTLTFCNVIVLLLHKHYSHISPVVYYSSFLSQLFVFLRINNVLVCLSCYVYLVFYKPTINLSPNPPPYL